MARSRNPTADQLRELMDLARIAGVGATNPAPNVFPKVFEDMGFRQRPEPRHTYLGMTTTRPDDASALFSFSYLDAQDGVPNEDAYLFTFEPPQVTPYPGTSFEKVDPRFRGHRGPKSYFASDI